MYLVINKWVTAVKVPNFSSHYLRNRSTLDKGVLGYIGTVWSKEHSPEVSHIPPVTPCIYIYIYIYIYTHTHTHTHIHIHKCHILYVYVCVCVYVNISIHTHTYIYIYFVLWIYFLSFPHPLQLSHYNWTRNSRRSIVYYTLYYRVCCPVSFFLKNYYWYTHISSVPCTGN